MLKNYYKKEGFKMSNLEVYKNIKNELLNDDNIYEVSVNSTRGLVTIKPVQNKPFMNLKDPLENFMDDELIIICGREFKLAKYEHFNTQIFELVLKEVG